MANYDATIRLLYAILSQKCLKDVGPVSLNLIFMSPLSNPFTVLMSKYQIDWNKVAHDPILSQEITNGHAARMRYSRFKKQMEGTAPVRRLQRNNNGGPCSAPKKSKVEKKASGSHREIKTPPRTVKSEADESLYGIGDDIPEAAGYGTQNPVIDVVKREHSPGSLLSVDEA